MKGNNPYYINNSREADLDFDFKQNIYKEIFFTTATENIILTFTVSGWSTAGNIC